MLGTKPIRTYVYIDGFNLYYGLLRGQPAARWLDLEAFVKGFLPERYEVARIYYFTAKLKAYPSSIEKARRQGIYLKALEANPLIEIIEGVYRLHAVSLPLADDETRFVRVLRAEEKRTDVNIAAHLLKDAFNHQADSFVLVSGDSDLTAPVAFVRKVAQNLSPSMTRTQNKYLGNSNDMPLIIGNWTWKVSKGNDCLSKSSCQAVRHSFVRNIGTEVRLE